MSNICYCYPFNCSWVLQIEAHSRYYKGALAQKRLFLVICTTFRSAFYDSWKKSHSTLNSSFNALTKWHEPDINVQTFLILEKFDTFRYDQPFWRNARPRGLPSNRWREFVFPTIQVGKVGIQRHIESRPFWKYRFVRAS